LGIELRASFLLHRCSTTWATPPVTFCYGYFGDRDLDFAQADLDHISPILRSPLSLGWQACSITSNCWDGVSWTFLPGLAWNCSPPDLSPHIVWDDRCTPWCPAIGWDGVSQIPPTPCWIQTVIL
jgi:hypothetical protein